MEAIEGSLGGIDTTLNNPMPEYRAGFMVMGARVKALTWVVGIQMAIVLMVCAALLAVATRAI